MALWAATRTRASRDDAIGMFVVPKKKGVEHFVVAAFFPSNTLFMKSYIYTYYYFKISYYVSL